MKNLKDIEMKLCGLIQSAVKEQINSSMDYDARNHIRVYDLIVNQLGSCSYSKIIELIQLRAELVEKERKEDIRLISESLYDLDYAKIKELKRHLNDIEEEK